VISKTISKGEFELMRKRILAGLLALGLSSSPFLPALADDLAYPAETNPELFYSRDQATPVQEYLGEGTKKGKGCSPCPTVYGYAEALFMQRTNSASNQPILIQQQNGVPTGTVLSTNDLFFDYDPALRIVVGHRLHDGWGIEGQFFGLFDASASESIVITDPAINITFPGGLGDANVFGDPDRVRADYSSALYSGELNLVHCCGSVCGPSKDKSEKGGHFGYFHTRTLEWFVGFRYVNLNEQLRISGERDQVNQDGTIGVESGVYDLSTSNNLFGPQIGARLRRWNDRWGWEATGKVGLLASDKQQEQYVTDFDDFDLRPLTTASDQDVAFLGELNFTGLYRLNETWNLRAGYSLMWISGVALAPDQLDFSGEIGAGNQVASNGGVFLHGVNLGIEARW
jgi:hypothetical protein